MDHIYKFTEKKYKGEIILFLEVYEPKALNNGEVSDRILREYHSFLSKHEKVSILINAGKIGITDISIDTMRKKIPGFIKINNSNKDKIRCLSVVLGNKFIASIIEEIKRFVPSEIEKRTKITYEVKVAEEYIKSKFK